MLIELIPSNSSVNQFRSFSILNLLSTPPLYYTYIICRGNVMFLEYQIERTNLSLFHLLHQHGWLLYGMQSKLWKCDHILHKSHKNTIIVPDYSGLWIQGGWIQFFVVSEKLSFLMVWGNNLYSMQAHFVNPFDWIIIFSNSCKSDHLSTSSSYFLGNSMFLLQTKTFSH